MWVLQARPITTSGAAEPGDGFDTPADPSDRHVAAGVTEMLPGVLPPLIWTINAPMIEEAFRSLFARLHALPPSKDLVRSFGFLARRRGRARLNLSLMERVGERMAGWSADEVQRLYLGAEADEPAAAGSGGRRFHSPIASWRALRLRGDAPRAAVAFVAASAAAGPAPEELLDHELVAYRWRLRDLAAVGVRAEMTVAAVAVAAYRALEEMLERWIGEEAAEWAQRLTRAAGRAVPSPSAVARRRLLALDAATQAAVIETVRAAGEEAPGRVRELGAEAARFVDAVERDLGRLGSAAVYAGETWAERAGLVWASLAAASGGAAGADTTSPADDLAAIERRLTSMRRWRVTRWLTGQVVDMRLRFFRRMVADTTELLGRREEAKAALLSVGGKERRVIIEMTRRLIRRGLLDKSSDVDLLADWELDTLLLERRGPRNGDLKRRRRALRRWRAEPAVTPAPQPAVVATSGEMEGWGASPGIHRGPVVVVLDPFQSGPIPEGAVLVAAATDPSWVPLMLRAGALVVERGGPLSHAAIVAREFGLPAVLNVADATSRLDPGSQVEVNGTAGKVRILAEEAVAADSVDWQRP